MHHHKLSRRERFEMALGIAECLFFIAAPVAVVALLLVAALH